MPNMSHFFSPAQTEPLEHISEDTMECNKWNSVYFMYNVLFEFLSSRRSSRKNSVF